MKYDLTGRKFHRLTVVGLGGWKPNGKTRLQAWICKCECGTVREFSGRLLVKGEAKSCGCWNMDVLMARNTKHGHSEYKNPSPTYVSWQAMKDRCENPNSTKFYDYGGRGISMCTRWHNFENFLEDMGERPDRNHSIDRIDVDGDYEPGNCRWATIKVQARNKRRTKWVTIHGQKRRLAEVAEESGLQGQTIADRIKRGVPDHLLLTKGHVRTKKNGAKIYV